MQIVTHSIHHAARGVLSTRAAPAAAVGGRRESMCRPAPAPRATRHSGPAWFPVQQRHYAQVTPADSAIAAAPASRDKHCGFEPEQVQQVLWRCRGIGFRVIAAPRSAQADMFKDVVAMCFSNQEADGSRAGCQSLAPWPRPYDPDMEYGASHAGAVMLFVNGHHEIHSRNVPLNYLILAEKAWAITVAGTNPAVSGQEKISCAKISFPANSLVQLSLVKGMLHGFEGCFGAVCIGVAKPAQDWPWSESSATPRWAERKPVKVDAEKVQLIGGKEVPWNVIREWQSTMVLEKSPGSIAWELARMHVIL